MHSNIYRWIENIILFFGIPLYLMLSLPNWMKGFVIVLSLLYVIVISWKGGFLNWKELFTFPRMSWKGILSRFGLTVLLTGLLMWIFLPDDFLLMVRKRPEIWILFVGIYAILSVIPQELIFRSFFFKRYESLFNNRNLFILWNAIIFSFAHIILNNGLVLVLTFIGGLLFGFTYQKTRSLWVVSIEHALYGAWLFTLGIGEWLAFPGVDF